MARCWHNGLIKQSLTAQTNYSILLKPSKTYKHCCIGLQSVHIVSFAAMSSMPEDLVDKLNKLVSNEDVPVLKRVQQVFECLQKNGFGHKAMLKPRETLTHPSNRGGSLLNATDVWDKGMRMVGIGIQPSMLQEGGVAFEISTDQTTKQSKLKANEEVVAGSNGALAKVSMEERYLTVATSHTAAFCKAVEQGCKSADGMSVEMKSDDGLHKIITEGWPMFVINEMVERSIPSLPAWLQMAMNSVNMGFKQVNEIEAAALMAEFIKHGKTLNEALAQVEKTDPLCKPQLHAIAYYVSRYGGGDQQSLLKFLSQFSTLAKI